MSVCKLKAGGLLFEVDYKDEKSFFEEIAHIQEVFDQTCGKCGNPDIKFVVRKVEKYKFYEFRCKSKSCGARLSFGSHEEGGTLFPKRKDEDGNYLPDQGWTKWDHEAGKQV